MTVERIYITRGDNCYSYCRTTGREVKSDKCIGIKIDGKNYWLNGSTCCLRCAEYIFQPFGIVISGRCVGRSVVPGAYRHGDEDAHGYNMIPVPITRVPGHQDDVFNGATKWCKEFEREKLSGIASLWHDPSTLARQLSEVVA